MSDCLLINVLLLPNAATSVETIATAADGFKPDNATLDRVIGWNGDCYLELPSQFLAAALYPSQ